MRCVTRWTPGCAEPGPPHPTMGAGPHPPTPSPASRRGGVLLACGYTWGMNWELWDTESGNMVGDYASESEALNVVRDALRRHGSSGVVTLALGAEHGA